MEQIQCYEFNIQIFFEEGEWNYSIIQEFEDSTDAEIEPLLRGTADSLKDASQAVSTFMSELTFE